MVARIGLIGAGTFGEMHLHAYSQMQKRGRAELVSIADIDAEILDKRRQEYEVATYLDYRQMLEEERLDAVAVATPDHLHREITVGCLKAGKHVLVEFHGSDWCPPCIKLNKEVLTKDAFKSFADSSLVLVDADFPRKTKLPEEQSQHNDALAKKFGVQYFPTIVIIDGDGKVLDQMVGFPEGGLDGFVSFISSKIES